MNFYIIRLEECQRVELSRLESWKSGLWLSLSFFRSSFFLVRTESSKSLAKNLSFRLGASSLIKPIRVVGSILSLPLSLRRQLQRVFKSQQLAANYFIFLLLFFKISSHPTSYKGRLRLGPTTQDGAQPELELFASRDMGSLSS